MREFHAERDRFHKELDRLLELLAAQRRHVASEARKSELVAQAETQAVRRRLVETPPRKLAPILQGDMAEARFVLAAQYRANRHVA
jgi:hypothetical protein